jgi:acyl-CoA thioester hydrolase
VSAAPPNAPLPSLPWGTSELSLQPRYSETDAMGFVYYANYLVYFEVARTTALADLGHPYWEMEKQGWLIPVLSAHCDYHRPARYGDTLILRTRRSRLGRARIRFEYEVRRAEEEPVLCTGFSEHAFMSPEGKPLRPPAKLLELFPEA